MLEDLETKMMKEMPYELLKDEQKKKLGKNNEAKMPLYNALPRKEYTRVFMYKTTKDIWHTLIITHQDKDYANKNHVRMFLRALLLRWRPKVTMIEEAKDLLKLPLDELIPNLNVYEMVLRNDGAISKSTKDKVNNEDEYEELNLIARNFRKFFLKDNKFGRDNRFGSGGNTFGKSRDYGNKGEGSSRKERECYNLGDKGHFISECQKPKENKAFIGGAWSDSEDGDQPDKVATCLMAIDSQ
ncbi:zf-CCHC domain-containing protein [Tanacetum coccineum]